MQYPSAINKLLALALACGLGVGIARPASATIITNGDFKAAPTVLNPIPGWTLGGNVGTTPAQPPSLVTTNGQAQANIYNEAVPSNGGDTEAVYFVADNADQTLSQTVSLQAGTTYDLSFGLYATTTGANNANPFSLSSTLASGTSIPLVDVTFQNPGVAGGLTVPVGTWTVETEIFTATNSGLYALTFTFISGATPAKDVLIDNVAISAVPEPFSIALMATGMLGLGLVRRFRA